MKRQILVIDDDTMILDVVKEALENIDFNVVCTDNPEEAKMLFHDNHFDIILTDLNMEPITGIEFAKYLFANYQKIPPIVLMTGFGSIETVVESMKLGIKDYLVKPFKINTLINTIQKVIKSAKMENEYLKLKEIVEIYSASESISNALDIEEVAKSFVKNLQNIINIDAVVLYINDDFDVLKTKKEYLAVRKRLQSYKQKIYEPLIKKLHLKKISKRFPENSKSLIFKKDCCKSDFNVDAKEAVYYLLKTGDKVVGITLLLNFFEKDEFYVEKLAALKIIFDEAAMALYNAYLYKKNQEMFLRTWQTLAMTIDAKDKYTHFHSTNVSKYSEIIGYKLNLTDSEVQELCYGALLHDIGKIGIPEVILNKPARLTDEEMEIIKQHPVIGKTILNPIQEQFPNIVDMVYYHHEKFDGTGYPEGIPSKELPINVRIISLADTLDAMSSDRAYRKKIKFNNVVAEIRRHSGTQFDPTVVEAFLDALPEIKALLKINNNN